MDHHGDQSPQVNSFTANGLINLSFEMGPVHFPILGVNAQFIFQFEVYMPRFIINYFNRNSF